jgi:outer membrane protein OmpA-like peptidoglycan-associated protein
MHGELTVSGFGYRAEMLSDVFGKATFRIRPIGPSTLKIHREGYAPVTRRLSASGFDASVINRLVVYLGPLTHTGINVSSGLLRQARSGLSNTISFDSRPLDVDVQDQVVIDSTAEAMSDSLSGTALKVIAVEVINDLPALMFVRNDSIYQASATSESTLENTALGLEITIPRGAKRHDYEEIIRRQIKSQGHTIGRFLLIRSFFFDSGKDWVRNDASAQLDKIIEVMVAHPNIGLQMTFHADSRGTDAFNLRLSKSRAEAVIAYLGESGIARERIVSRFVGESQPLNDCGDLSDCDELLHQINRTAEFKFIFR